MEPLIPYCSAGLNIPSYDKYWQAMVPYQQEYAETRRLAGKISNHNLKLYLTDQKVGDNYLLSPLKPGKPTSIHQEADLADRSIAIIQIRLSVRKSTAVTACFL